MKLVVFVWLLVAVCVLYTSTAHGSYTNRWAVHVPAGEDAAKAVAEQHGFHFVTKIVDDYYEFEHPHVMKRSTKFAIDHHAHLENHPHVKWVEQQVAKSRKKRDVKRDVHLNDPQWPRMWYLNRRGHDMNVQDAWQQGYTGKGSVVTILDDGIEKDHPDLKNNYDPLASYDVNDHDSDPQPRLDFTNFNRHGTRCAGEVAAEANNNLCSVGVAYNAGIGGVRMLDGDVTDSVEAQSLALNIQHIDIYSASWGPDDDGKTVDGPGPLAKQAFRNGINKGRGGKGSIFVWASGNGGRDHDACSCDGYTNSIETLSVSSASQKGNIPWYLEPCASTLATTYSSGGPREKQVLTTDLRHGCTETHTGTSASAPMAAGIVALALEANPSITWRDLQYIVLMTAKPSDLHASDWISNGVGRRVSHAFGYGLMDAGAMTDLAKRWKTVPPQHKCVIDGPVFQRNHASSQDQLRFSLNSHGCKSTPDNKVVYLEHVQVVLDMDTSKRGDIEIFLTSPQGTRSTLLQKRARDSSKAGFSHWPFLTVHSWGEIATGSWILDIKTYYSSASVKSWKLILYGTDVDPLHPSSHAHEPHPAEATPSHISHPSNASKSVPLPVNNGNLRCKDNEYFLNNFCYQDCPSHFFASNQTILNSARVNETSEGSQILKSRPICQQCHLLCLDCFGGKNNQCFSCPGGYELMSNKTCVHIMSEYQQGYGKTGPVLAVVIIVCVVSIVIVILVFLCLQARDRGSSFYKFFQPKSLDAEYGKKFGLLINHDSESEEDYSKEDTIEYSDGLE